MIFLLYLDSVNIREWEKPAHPSKLKKKCNYETPYCRSILLWRWEEAKVCSLPEEEQFQRGGGIEPGKLMRPCRSKGWEGKSAVVAGRSLPGWWVTPAVSLLRRVRLSLTTWLYLLRQQPGVESSQRESVKQSPDTVRVWDAIEGSRSNRQGRAFFFEHGVKASNDINTLNSIVCQPLSVQVRHGEEKNDPPRRQSKLT